MSQRLEFEKDLKVILEKDKRYHKEAYLFVFEALEYCINKIGERRHVTGRELLMGIKEYLLERYGFLSLPLLERWGVKKTIDFGHIVFNLVDNGLMRKTDEDDIDDFGEVFSLRKELYDNFNFNVKELDLTIRVKKDIPFSDK